MLMWFQPTTIGLALHDNPIVQLAWIAQQIIDCEYRISLTREHSNAPQGQILGLELVHLYSLTGKYFDLHHSTSLLNHSCHPCVFTHRIPMDLDPSTPTLPLTPCR